MKTIVFFSATQGVLGEASLVKSFAHAFLKDRASASPDNPDWQFVFNDSEPVEKDPGFDTGAVLLIVPTVQGLVWAQRQKNKLVLSGMPVSRIAAILLFAQESSALPLNIVAGTMGIFVNAVNCSLGHLFWVHNDDERRATFAIDALRSAANHVHEQFERAWTSPARSDISWRSIEKEVLNTLWSAGPSAPAMVLSPDEMAQRIRAHLAACLSRRRLTPPDAALLQQLERRLIDHVTGLGPLEPLLRDPDVNEIMIVGTACLYVERKGEMTRIPPPFEHETHLRTLIERIVAPSGRRVDWAAPFCDVRLKDGSRVNIVLPPLALDGPCVTIRRFRPGFSSMENLESAGTVDREQARRLERAVLERKNIVIAGNTGAGKTTLMNVLAALIPETERILTLEDAAELAIAKPHVVRMETRSANTEGKGAITMRDLVVNALRMRPDRLLVGECRGDEVIPMLQAMNTGHDGSMTTLHANSAEDVGPRLESLVSMSAPSWSLELVRQQIRSAFDVIVYMKRDGANLVLTKRF